MHMMDFDQVHLQSTPLSPSLSFHHVSLPTWCTLGLKSSMLARGSEAVNVGSLLMIGERGRQAGIVLFCFSSFFPFGENYLYGS